MLRPIQLISGCKYRTQCSTNGLYVCIVYTCQTEMNYYFLLIESKLCLSFHWFVILLYQSSYCFFPFSKGNSKFSSSLKNGKNRIRFIQLIFLIDLVVVSSSAKALKLQQIKPFFITISLVSMVWLVNTLENLFAKMLRKKSAAKRLTIWQSLSVRHTSAYCHHFM